MAATAPLVERRLRVDRRTTLPEPHARALREAIAADAVSLRFQPQFTAQGGALAGAEALVRLDHAALGELAGDALFALAAKGGEAVRLSRRVTRRALAEASTWPGHLRLSLNVTAADLACEDFAEDLADALDASGFPACRLTLEITEQALVEQSGRSARALGGLRANGIRIALDDFGTGFCNFAYLKTLPLDALKLDRSMIAGITEDDRDLAVLRGIVAMARALGLTVIAEGVETEAQRAVIAAEGCAVWQGFLGGAPMAPQEFVRL